MREREDLFVTKVGRLETADATRERRSSIPTGFELQAVRRLRIVCLVVAAVFLISWLVLAFFFAEDPWGNMAREFSLPFQWVPPVVSILASIALAALSKSRRLSPATLLRLGLVYEVVIAYGITFSTGWGTFDGIPGEAMNSDRIGLTSVATWILFFAALVPTKPRQALIAMITSATAPAVVYWLMVQAAIAPMLPAGKFLTIWVVPYAITVVMAYLAARIIHRMGVAVREAREMGSYRLEALLGRGGMGEVWRASHRLLARPAAVKLIRPDALASDPASVGSALARFEREAQVTASLRSPHTVELYDFGTTEDGTLYYVMELLNGFDLEHLVERFGPLPPERVVHVLLQACSSLAEAHHKALVHRDIKPANLYLCRQGLEVDVVKVLDFGLVKPGAGSAQPSASLTGANAVAGTPSYMAPEMVLGNAPMDHRADIYSLGCVAYWLLTGRLVFEESSATAMMVAHAKEEPLPPSVHSEISVPPALDALIVACLAKDLGNRPQSAQDLAEALAGIEVEKPWSRDRAQRWWSMHQPAG